MKTDFPPFLHVCIVVNSVYPHVLICMSFGFWENVSCMDGCPVLSCFVLSRTALCMSRTVWLFVCFFFALFCFCFLCVAFDVWSGLGFVSGRGNEIKTGPFCDHTYNGWGPGARLRALVKAPGGGPGGEAPEN